MFKSRLVYHLCGSLLLFVSTGAVAEQSVQICRLLTGEQMSAAAWLADSQENSLRYAPDRQVDVVHIKIDVTPDFADQTVAGTTTITFVPISQPLKELRLDAVNLTIQEVRSAAHISDHVSTNEDLTIAFDPPISVGQESSVAVTYEAQPKQGLYFRTPEMGYPASDTHIWTQGEPHEARHWFPCYDYPNERSSTEVVCRVPSEMTVLSNGKKVAESIDSQTGLKQVRWVQEKPHVAYLICLVAGNLRSLEQKHGDLTLALYTQPSLIEHASNSFADTADIMAFFEREIGVPFPWDKYYQVTVFDPWFGGMENTSLTTLTDRTIFRAETENIRTTRQLDAHEMAHQWFGDYVTCKDWSHIWLNEGFATFYAHLYEGHKFGRDAMLYGLYRDAEREVFRSFDFQRRTTRERTEHKPMVYRAYETPMEQFDYRAYPKGSWVLHMLRSQLGEDLFRRCIQEYLERHRLTSVVTEDLNKVVEQVSGRSFDAFFDQWVYHARHPDLTITYDWLPTEKLAKVSIEQTQEINDQVLVFRFPALLRFVVDGRSVDHAIEVRQRRHDFYVPLASQPTIVRFDPEYTVLADVTFRKPDEMLIAQLANQDDVIGRLLAAEELGKRKTLKSVAHLKTALNSDPFFGVRIAASSALGSIRDKHAFDALAGSLDQPDARVRLQVVDDLGDVYRPETIDRLQEIVEREANPAIQASAIRSLGRFGGERSRSLISTYLRSQSFRGELAEAAIAAIRMQRDSAFRAELLDVIPERERAFTSRGFAQALDTLAQVAREDDDRTAVLELIQRYVNHPKETIRLGAVRALGSLGDPRAAAVLESLAGGDSSDRMTPAAQRALERLQAEAPLVPEEISELRRAVTELRESNEKLRQELDELKAKQAAQR